MNREKENPFQDAAGRIRNRLGKVYFTNWLTGTHWIAGLASISAVVFLRQFCEWRNGEIWIVLILLTTWLLVGAVKGILSRPSTLEALTIFDEAGNWKDQFSSAFFYLQNDATRPLKEGEQLHVTKAKEDLKRQTKKISETLPLPKLSRVWIFPLVALLFAISPLLRKSVAPGDTVLTKEMIESAIAEAARIRRATRDLNRLEALSEKEKIELQNLESSVAVATDEITHSEGQTAREVLSTLESRARAAERLAEQLGLADEEWASEEFLRELSQHADTADLAIGIKDRNSRLVADQSTAIAETLKHDGIKRETADRFTIALERSTAKATTEDGRKPVGERIGNASKKMTAQSPKSAAGEFQELAKHFRRAIQREQAQKKLEKLAAQLRTSGSRISGSKLENLKKIADTPKALPDGLKPIDSMPMAHQLQNLIAPQNPNPSQVGGTSMPIPGITKPAVSKATGQ